MSVIRSLVVSLSLFSRIPLPKMDWTTDSTRWAVAFLPLVGAVIGAVLLLWQYLAGLLGLGAFLYGAGVALLPLLITGALHMDGFCDTVDALASNGDTATRQRILKDSSTGAFAVIGAVAYLIFFAALASELKDTWLLFGSFCCVFVLSRSLGGLSLMWIAPAHTSGLGHTFASGSQKTPTIVILLTIAFASAGGMVLLGGVAGVVAVLVALLVLCVLRFWLARQFDGLSGDLVGWFVQMCELCCLAGLVFTHLITLAW